jgi:sigma-B regulation protein RsbU (phosphoserine phosphatase)
MREPLLIFFGILAGLYGLRLWVQADLSRLLAQDSNVYWRLYSAVNYLVPIPFVLYLQSAGLLRSRVGMAAAYALALADSVLAVATLAFGPRHSYDRINESLVIAALAILIAEFIRKPQRENEDFVVVRRGLLLFAGFALWDNVSGMFFALRKVEAVGFAIFLGCLGYVAARRMLRRDRQLNEIQKELDVAKRIQLSILPAEFPHLTALLRGRALLADDYGGRRLLRLCRGGKWPGGTPDR